MAEGCLPCRCNSSAMAEEWNQQRDKASALSERALSSGKLVSANTETKSLSGKNLSAMTEGSIQFNNCSKLSCVIAFVMRANSYLHCVRGFVIRANSEWGCVRDFVIRENSNQVSVGGFIMLGISNRCCVMGYCETQLQEIGMVMRNIFFLIGSKDELSIFFYYATPQRSMKFGPSSKGQKCLEKEASGFTPIPKGLYVYNKMVHYLNSTTMWSYFYFRILAINI